MNLIHQPRQPHQPPSVISLLQSAAGASSIRRATSPQSKSNTVDARPQKTFLKKEGTNREGRASVPPSPSQMYSKMRRQRALHLIFGATIALGIGDIVVAASESRGGPSSSSSSTSSLGGGGGRRPTMRSPSFARGRLPPSLSSSSSSSSSGRDGLRSIGGGRGPGLSSSSRRRGGRSEEVADLDGLDLDLDDDGSTRAYSPIGGDDADGLARDAAADGGGIDRMLEDFEYEMGGMMEDDDFDLDDRLLDDGDTEGGEGYNPFEGKKEDDSDGEYGQGSEKGALYDAYNLLHSLAQVRDFDFLGSRLLHKMALVSCLPLSPSTATFFLPPS